MDERELLRQAAIISSMTRTERDSPKLMNASRKRRVAAGSGTSVQDVNKVLKMHRQMADMMKKLGKGGMKGLAGMLGGGMPGGLGGGMPNMPDMNQLGGPGGLGGNPGDLPPDLLKGLGLPSQKGPKK
jgi:signal recognition particle subunit SRP54